jgi:hypothetical protein
MVYTLSRSRKASAKPTAYMATATAFAIENITPMAPPNSGPNKINSCEI